MDGMHYTYIDHYNENLLFEKEMTVSQGVTE